MLPSALENLLHRAGWIVEVLLLPMGPRKSDIDLVAIKRVAAKHPEVRILDGWSPPKFASAYNRLVAEAAGEVFMMGNDDFWPLEDRALLSLVEKAREPSVGLVAGRVHGSCFNPVQRTEGGEAVSRLPLLLPAFRREVFDEVGGFDAKVFTQYGEEDIDFRLRVMRRGYLALMAPERWQHQGQVTARKFDVLASPARRRNMRAFERRWGFQPGDFDAMRPPCPNLFRSPWLFRYATLKGAGFVY